MPSASTPEILDALAGKRTLDQAWEGVMIPTSDRPNGVPGWQCRECGWMIGAGGLPPLECGRCHASWDLAGALAGRTAVQVLDALAPPLHVFYLDSAEEWWVALSPEDAKRQALREWGGKWEDYALEGEEFVQWPDAATIKIVCNAQGHPDEDGVPISRTCRDWADREGPGVLCSANR